MVVYCRLLFWTICRSDYLGVPGKTSVDHIWGIHSFHCDEVVRCHTCHTRDVDWLLRLFAAGKMAHILAQKQANVSQQLGSAPGSATSRPRAVWESSQPGAATRTARWVVFFSAPVLHLLPDQKAHRELSLRLRSRCWLMFANVWLACAAFASVLTAVSGAPPGLRRRPRRTSCSTLPTSCSRAPSTSACSNCPGRTPRRSTSLRRAPRTPRPTQQSRSSCPALPRLPPTLHLPPALLPHHPAHP